MRRTARATGWTLALLALLAAAPPAPAAGSSTDEPVHLHTTAPGDTLIGLARRLLVEPARWPELQRLNGVRNPRRLPVGGTLRIPLSLMRSEAVPGEVSAVRGDVRSGDTSVTPGLPLPEGSELRTGDDGHVTVRLVDGTVLRLRSGSRVRIDESRRLPGAGSTRSGVRLEQGRVEVDAQPARGGQPGFRIVTPQGVLGVRGTAFRVDADETRTRGEVLEGVVAARGAVAADEQRVAAGYGTVIDAGGRVAPPTPLLPAPDLSGLPPLHQRPLVRLNLPLPPGAVGWRVQVGADDRFEALLADVRSQVPELRIAGLDDGRHPIRLRAVAANGLEGLDARGTLTLKARPEPPLPRAPAARAVVRGERVEFAWAASSEARRYRLQLARVAPGSDPAAAAFDAPLQDLQDLDALTAIVQPLPPGHYAWRLASVRADGDAGPFGDPQGFELRPLPPPVAPPTPPSVGDQSIRIFWQGLPGQLFDFQLARDAAFTQVIEERRTERTEIEMPLPGSGRFHLRLRARDADGFVGPWSASQHVDVVPCVRVAQGACVRVEGGNLQLQ